MKFTFRTEGAPTPAHETMRVFVNGASAGLLTMRTEEAAAFKRALAPLGIPANPRSLSDALVIDNEREDQ